MYVDVFSQFAPAKMTEKKSIFIKVQSIGGQSEFAVETMKIRNEQQSKFHRQQCNDRSPCSISIHIVFLVHHFAIIGQGARGSLQIYTKLSSGGENDLLLVGY